MRISKTYIFCLIMSAIQGLQLRIKEDLFEYTHKKELIKRYYSIKNQSKNNPSFQSKQFERTLNRHCHDGAKMPID